MAITAVSSTELNQVGDGLTATYTFTFDIGTRTNGGLIVNIGVIAPVVKTVSSVTWNGVALSKAVSLQRNIAAGIEHDAEQWYLANPANGSNTLSVTFSLVLQTTDAFSFEPSWWDGMHQTQATVLDQTTSGSGSTDPSVSLTPGGNNEVIIDMYLSESNNILTAGGSPAAQTVLQTHDFGPRTVGSSYVIQTTAGAQTMNWTGVDDQWTGVAASYKEAASAFDAATFPRGSFADFVPRRDTMIPSGRVA